LGSTPPLLPPFSFGIHLERRRRASSSSSTASRPLFLFFFFFFFFPRGDDEIIVSPSSFLRPSLSTGPLSPAAR